MAVRRRREGVEGVEGKGSRVYREREGKGRGRGSTERGRGRERVEGVQRERGKSESGRGEKDTEGGQGEGEGRSRGEGEGKERNDERSNIRKVMNERERRLTRKWIVEITTVEDEWLGKGRIVGEVDGMGRGKEEIDTR